MSDPFWADDISILYDMDRLREFYPSPDMTDVEKLNCIVRFSLFLGILLYLYHSKPIYFYIPIVIMTSTYLFREIRNRKELKLEDFKNKNKVKEEKCSKPTSNNPFMNPNFVTDNFETKEKPCNPLETEVQKDIDIKFNENLFKDVSDVYGRINSDRQFYTVPVSQIPNKQKEFGEWLYGGKTCKGDNVGCLKYKDLRQQKPILQKDLVA